MTNLSNTHKRRVAIFADVQNIYYTTRQAYQRQFNYRAFWQQVSEQNTIVLAYAYATYRSDNQQQRDQQHKFQRALQHIGFEVKLKPFIQRSDGSAKGDWDVGIAVDILETASDGLADHIILLSGDGDFDILLDKVYKKYNVNTQVYGIPILTAQSLIQSTQHFQPITESLLI